MTDMIFAAIKGFYGASTLVSWAYTSIGLIAFQEAGIPLPEWWYTAAAVAVVTFLIMVGLLVHDILTGLPRHRSRRAKRRARGYLGTISYVGGCWAAVKEEGEEA